MTNERDAAREVHALLLSAHPHRDDIDLKAAAEISLTAESEHAKRTLLSIQLAIMAIHNGVGSVQGQTLLLEAIRNVEQWVRCACLEGDQ